MKAIIRSTRTSDGFTLIELLVGVVVIGILASISVPNYISARQKSFSAVVKGNMHISQVSAECYAVDYAGMYPTGVTDLLPFFPGIGGTFPDNPITKTSNETPAPCSLSSVSEIQAGRTDSGPTNYGGGEGQTTYSAIVDESGSNTSYAITGNGSGGNAVAGDKGHLILSNQ